MLWGLQILTTGEKKHETNHNWNINVSNKALMLVIKLDLDGDINSTPKK